MSTYIIGFDFIQLFAEGGGGEGGTGAGGQTAAAPAQQQGDLSSVQYGVQETQAAVPETVDDRAAKFDSLIKGEYKDLYEQRMKDTVSRRLKGNEETVKKYNDLAPTLDLLASKYGVDAGDIKALNKAIEEDETFYEDEALEKGLTVQQVKEIRKMQRENAQLRKEMEQRETQQQTDAILAGWMQQEETVRQIYPSFSLSDELQNEQFARLLQNGIDVQTAFEVIHHEEILPAAMQYTAKQVEQKVVNNIRAGKARPAEGAMGNQASVQYKSDVSQLTDADMDEINRRVMRGERIRF